MTLPTPDPIALAHSEKLAQHIRLEIEKAAGHISFAQFMNLALYTPGLGYYSAGMHKLGKSGDFVTAPEISPLFAACVARQIHPVLSELGSGDILEIGAGSGIFAKDLLQELENLGGLPEKYYILEVSADLRERQKQCLTSACPQHLSRITWLDTLPSEMKGVIFANEVMDALPVHCFQISKGELYERSVTWKNHHFEWDLTLPSEALLKQIQILQQEYDLPEHYQSEINLMLPAWIRSLANTLKKGLILLSDYGYGRAEYYHPDRDHGTLTCFYQHRHHNNPFAFVGLQDITSHVDFTSVAESAVESNLSLGGYTTQAAFLLACGLLNLANSNLDPVKQYQQSQAIKTLTLPSEMGEVIKFISLTKDLEIPLIGFELQDRRRDL